MITRKAAVCKMETYIKKLCKFDAIGRKQNFLRFYVDIGFQLWYAEYVGAVSAGTADFFISGGYAMVRELVHDPFLLARKSAPATREDVSAARDLLDTLVFHREGCVGMAANMIGVCRRIIVFQDGAGYMTMFNPVILKREGEYETEEGCLSLLGGPRKTKRYQKIKVQYQTEAFQTRLKTFTGWTAQIIQHEIDHCNGILI